MDIFFVSSVITYPARTDFILIIFFSRRKLEIKTCLEGLDVNAFGVQTP